MTITYENLLAFLYREARLLDDKQGGVAATLRAGCRVLDGLGR